MASTGSRLWGQRLWLNHDRLAGTPLIRDLVARGRDRGAYERWMQQVERTGYCSNPIRLAGRVVEEDPASGVTRELYSTAREPDGTLLLACGNRRASRCPSCSWTYRGDAYQIVSAGLQGGKGIPDSIADHPVVFVTLTAPSFGAVHSRREHHGKAQPCHPSRRTRARCPHRASLACYGKHDPDDELLGQPLCHDCFDYQGAVLWNAHASQLWKRTPTRILREVAALIGSPVRQLERRVRISFVKVAEMQHRGLIHFHAVIRFDGRPPRGQPEEVLAPPPDLTVELLVQALRRAIPRIVARTPPLLDRPSSLVSWGRQLDVQVIRLGGAEKLSAGAVASYVAKYATKQPEMFAALDHRISCEGDIEVLALNYHLRRLAATAWQLRHQDTLDELNLKLWAHQLGFRGHWLTKSRRYSTTFNALRQTRAEYRRGEDDHRSALPAAPGGDPAFAVRERRGAWRFCGAGYRTHADAWLAESRRRSEFLAREALRDEGRVCPAKDRALEGAGR